MKLYKIKITLLVITHNKVPLNLHLFNTISERL